jgi:hypothetical protein
MLKGLDNQSWRKLVVFEEVTEHAVDSIAVAYWGYKNTILSSGV